MNEAITPTKTISYHLEATAFEEDIDLSNATPTFQEIEALVNKALTGCVKDGKTPLRISLCQPGEYLRLVVHGVDVNAPQLIKQAFLDGGKSDEIKQEV
jgi:hypothetical protein